MDSFSLIFKCTSYLLRIQSTDCGVFQFMKRKIIKFNNGGFLTAN